MSSSKKSLQSAIIHNLGGSKENAKEFFRSTQMWQQFIDEIIRLKTMLMVWITKLYEKLKELIAKIPIPESMKKYMDQFSAWKAKVEAKFAAWIEKLKKKYREFRKKMKPHCEAMKEWVLEVRDKFIEWIKKLGLPEMFDGVAKSEIYGQISEWVRLDNLRDHINKWWWNPLVKASLSAQEMNILSTLLYNLQMYSQTKDRAVKNLIVRTIFPQFDHVLKPIFVDGVEMELNDSWLNNFAVSRKGRYLITQDVRKCFKTLDHFIATVGLTDDNAITQCVEATTKIFTLLLKPAAFAPIQEIVKSIKAGKGVPFPFQLIFNLIVSLMENNYTKYDTDIYEYLILLPTVNLDTAFTPTDLKMLLTMKRSDGNLSDRKTIVKICKYFGERFKNLRATFT